MLGLRFGDVSDAFARIEDPAERVRLAFKLFHSEGVALVNLLRNGSDALEEMRERAQSLGIVLDEHLVRDAERTELDTLSQVISANLTRAVLEAAPVVANLSGCLAGVAGEASIAGERAAVRCAGGEEPATRRAMPSGTSAPLARPSISRTRSGA